ncbi:FAD binding domain-containing protein [Brevibacillus nitrificans]|uniref:FAD binding domain-containing protein n=1 Tax=Brevibacillus nitrificans TaxID=651560 RepID=UPI002620B115|nr:FAD binding domain-containing protein [Brevibacillus nitrificans]MED1791421.1 FAD binding domain-containing protein [Brevibacillus nitrificans]
MKPVTFSYHRATSLEEALAWLVDYPEGKILAGGQSMVPMMNYRLARPEFVLDINRIPGLDYVERSNDRIRIGGLLRHQQLHENPIVRECLPALAEAAGEVGHWAIRNRGTLGGSLAHADPASELPAAMVAFGATLELCGADGIRKVPAEDFYLGFLMTALEPGEILTGVEIPLHSGTCYGFAEIARRAGDFALAGAYVETRDNGEGAVTWFGISGRPERRELLFAQDEEARKTQFTELVSELESLEEGTYRQRLGVVVAEQAYKKARGGNKA